MAKFWNERMLLGFDPTHWPNFRTAFQVGKCWISDSSPYVNCTRISELDVDF